LAFVFFLTALILFLFFAIRKKGTLHKKLTGYFPALAEVLDENTSVSIHQPSFIKGLLFSTAVEFSGILHVYLAMLALGSTASVTAAAVTYIAAVVMMIASPFLKGLGVVELSMMYVLHQFGYTTVTALSITILYRVFEFWLPLAMGLFVFVWKSRHFILRSMPAVFTFSLAVINITSAVTAPLHERFHLLRAYLPLTALHASAMMVLLFGLLLFVTSVFLFKGFRSAWIIAVIAAAASLVGHLTKALDYEEAVFAFFTLLILLATYRQYRMRSDAGWRKKGLLFTFSVLVSVLLFGFISFYFIDVKHFGIDFTWQQSLLHTFKSFLLIDDASIHPLTHFGLEFIWLIRCVGFSTWLFLFWSLIQPHVSRYTETDLQRMKAKDLLKQYGHSAVDYFKVYPDKLLFFSSHYDAFVSYRIANGFAVVLEEPVSAANQKVSVLKEFEHYCRKAGLKPAFYRVDAGSIHWFDELRKKRLLIGQEAVLDVTTFSLEGKERKSLRNGISNLQKKGYTAKLYEAPLNEHFVQALKKVSDEWLMEFGKSETVFSQGMFDANEIRHQDIITLENEKGEINAFLNIVPDYSANECTYDLIRKIKAAPGAAMDALILRLIDAAKAQQKKYINLGLVPMSGITQPQNRAEQLVKIAGDKIKTFQRYKGLREFKEKYASCWQNKYL
ncbi:MAG: lysylphosphatidylglycerol synthetase family protein, partial [Chitinophagaceae bacterium]|nr:lysylphosphatidylglycerol synthetase family protein [Chitinophagaceae bacterium]